MEIKENLEVKTDRYEIQFKEITSGGPGGYEATYLAAEGEPISDEFLSAIDNFEGKLLPLVNKNIRVRNDKPLAEAMRKYEDIGIASGFKPSGPCHFGHLLTSSAVRYFQQNGVQIFMPVADVEVEMEKNPKKQRSRDEYMLTAADNLLDWGAAGINLDVAHVYLQSEEKRVGDLAYLVGSFLDFSLLLDLYGNKKMIEEFPFIFGGMAQVGDILLGQHQDFGNKRTFMVSGPDQDGHMKMTLELTKRLLASKLKTHGIQSQPSGFYIPHIRGLTGDKASSSKSDATIYLGSGENNHRTGQIKRDIDERIKYEQEKFDKALSTDRDAVERCCLDFVRHIGYFNRYSNVDFSRVAQDPEYQKLMAKMETETNKQAVQKDIDDFLIGTICKNAKQDNVAIVRENLAAVLIEQRSKRQEVLEYAIQRVKHQPAAWDSDNPSPTAPEEWKVPERSIVSPDKRNKTEWQDIVYEAKDKILP